MIGLLAFVLLIIAIAAIVRWVIQRRRPAPRADTVWRSEVDFARSRLVAIRDSGPTGADPLPPCQWCKQGPGHWTTPAREDCPAVMAWRAIRLIDMPWERETSGQ